jgi:hypothetical protein
MPFKTVKIIKRIVARQEIEAAIDLFLARSSFIAANVLAWAAVDVLRSTIEAQGRCTLRSIVEKTIRPDKIDFWRKIERSSYTYSKHADRDPEDDHSFHPEAVSFVLFTAIADYGTAYSQCTITMNIFRAWIMAMYPDLFLGPVKTQSAMFRNLFSIKEGSTFAESLKPASNLYRAYQGSPADFLKALSVDQMAKIEL